MLNTNGQYTSNTDAEHVGSTYKWPNMKLGKTEPFPNHIVQLSKLAGEQQPTVMSGFNHYVQPQVSYGNYFQESNKYDYGFAASDGFATKSQLANNLTFATAQSRQRHFMQEADELSTNNYVSPHLLNNNNAQQNGLYVGSQYYNNQQSLTTVQSNRRYFPEEVTTTSKFNHSQQMLGSRSNSLENLQKNGHSFALDDCFTSKNQVDINQAFATVQPNPRYFAETSAMVTKNCASTSQFSNGNYTQQDPDDISDYSLIAINQEYDKNKYPAFLQPSQRYLQNTSTMVTNNCASTSQFSNENYTQQDPDDNVGHCLIATSQEQYSNKSPAIVQPSQIYSQISQPIPEKPIRTSYSIAGHIIKGLESTATKQMTLNELYRWFEIHDPKYSKNVKRRQNSLRHCLSYNDCFVPVRREVGKGKKNFFWKLHPDANNMFADGNYKRRQNVFRAKNKIENDDKSLPSAKRQRIA